MGLIERLPHKVGTRARLADEIFFGEFDQHALGACRHEAGRDFDERRACARRWHRHIFDGGLSVLHVLEELFHGSLIVW